MEFYMKMICDEEGYPTDIIIFDSNNILGTAVHPMVLNMVEIKKLHDLLEPVIQAYEKWLPLYEKYMYGELKKRPIMKIEKEIK